MLSNTPDYCANCHYPLAGRKRYCAHCGQRRIDKRVSLRGLLGDFFSTLFNFDGKIWRTLGALFVPGKLTEAYFAGQRARYLTPIRLFLSLATVSLALLIFIVPPEDDNSNDDFTSLGKKLERHVDHHAMAVRMDTLRVQLARGASPEARERLDSLYTLFWADEQRAVTADSTRLLTWTMVRETLTEADRETTQSLPRVASRDWFQLEPEALTDKYGVEGTVDRFLVRRQARFIRAGGDFNRFVLGNLFWLFVFLPLVLAFVFKLLYLRRKRYYVEHLVFNLHFYSFLFVVVLFVLPFRAHFSGVMAPLIITLGIYLYLALRRVYRQGWFKTLIKQLLAFVLLQFVLVPILLFWLLVNVVIF